MLDARYTVPPNPPPVIKLCAIAEDYAGNESDKCAEFPTGDVWKGTMRSEVQASFGVGPGYSCSSVFETTLKLVVNANGEISGDWRTVYVSSTCHRITPHFSLVTGGLKGRAYSDRLEFHFEKGDMVPAGSVNWGFGVGRAQGETPFVVPITAPGIAEGQSTARYDPNPGNHYGTTDMIRLRCETCARGVGSNREHQRPGLRYLGTASGRSPSGTTPEALLWSERSMREDSSSCRGT